VLGSISLLGSLAPASCLRAPEPCVADLDEGDVVITEIRGPQDGTWGEWIELYNASGRALDLRGMRGTLERLKGSDIDGEAELTFLIRDALPVEPGAYVVLGTLPLHPTRLPAVDYSINADFRTEPEQVEASGGVIIPPASENADPRALFGSARLRLFACDRMIDSLAYIGLPPDGTLAFDGARPPDAEDNDELCAHWCTDLDSPPQPEWTGATGTPGTPGMPNPPCPAEPSCD